jgi:predicted DNA-binding antitoxin AbrB/MazE fold protein
MKLAMVIAVEAIYENGVLKLKGPIPLQDKAEVRVTIEMAEPATASTSSDPADDFVGFIKNAPEGVPLAAEHDRYLYGDRRR